MAIGIVYHQQNKYEHALHYYNRTLSILKELPSDDKLDLAWIYNNIGCLYTDIGDLNQALEYQKKAYEIRKKSLSSIHPDIATSLTNIGRIHQALAQHSNGNSNEIEKALENYKTALEIRQESLPIDHPDLAISYYNLALVHFDQQKYQQAYIEIERAMDIQKKIFSSNHPQTQQTLKLEIQIKLMLDYHRK
jgi:tetratricopeptide (TPR) repeat protein